MANEENTDKMGVGISTDNDQHEPLQKQVFYIILNE